MQRNSSSSENSSSSDELHGLLGEAGKASTEGAARYSEASPSPKGVWNALARWTGPLVLLCTVIDVVLLTSLFIVRFPQPAPSPTSKGIIYTSELPFRSGYINFDKLYANATFPREKLKPIVNHARTFYQVSSKPDERDQSFAAWSNIRLEDIGMVPRYGQNLVVNSTMSTLAQFPVLDYGMESCSVAIRIPTHNKTEAVVSSPANVEVYWYPEITKKLDWRALTWNTKPSDAERKLLHTLSVGYGQTSETPQFPCKSMTYLTFELACTSCDVSVLSVDKKREGLYVRQFQTI